MARQIVVLALVLIALVGLVSAAKDAPNSSSPTTAPSPGANAAAVPGNDDDAIGNTDEAAAPAAGTAAGDDAVEGPIGSEEAANEAVPAAQTPTSGATTLGVSAVAAAAAAAVAGYFVF